MDIRSGFCISGGTQGGEDCRTLPDHYGRDIRIGGHGGLVRGEHQIANFLRIARTSNLPHEFNCPGSHEGPATKYVETCSCLELAADRRVLGCGAFEHPIAARQVFEAVKVWVGEVLRD